MKRIVLILYVILTACLLHTEFPIGTYSYIRSDYDEELFSLIGEANYTFHVAENMPDNSNSAKTLLDRSGKYGLKVLLIDRKELYSYMQSNYLCLEPEIQDDWYVLGQDTGSPFGESWVCDSARDEKGFVFKRLRYRGNGKAVGKIFQVDEDDTIYFRLRLSWSDDGLIHPDNFQPVTANLFCYSNNSKKRQILRVFNNASFTNLLEKKSGKGYFEHTFSCPVSSIPAEFKQSFDYGVLLTGLDFQLRWNGGGLLRVDKLEIFDGAYKKLLYNSKFESTLRNRKLLAENPFLMGFYAKDEPNTPQFEGLRVFKEKLGRVPILTANWVRQYEDSDGSYEPWDDFLETTDFDYIMPDIYPVKANARWNTSPEFMSWHIQDHIDSMLELYRLNKQSAVDHHAKFFAVVQTTGYWYGNDLKKGEWTGSLLPPPEMIKCLRYLPLCYGANGIIDWKLRSSKRNLTNKEWDYSYHQSPLDVSNRKTPQYKAIQESNVRIRKYGDILNKLKWLGAHHDPKEIVRITFELSKVNVTSAEHCAYDGFVEVGVFQGASLYFMIVNRRTNFLKPDFVDFKGALKDVGATGKDVANAFEPAPNQILELQFNDSYSKKWYLEETISKERIYLDSSNTARIDIEAGEGRLFKLTAE